MKWNGKGKGIKDDPYQIENLNQLQEVNNYLNNHNVYFILISDIDASDTQNWNDGDGFVPIGSETNQFRGKFDGRGHKIVGLYIYRPSVDDQALFGYTDHATIKNVGVTGCSVCGKYCVGGFIGTAFDSIITNCYSTGVVSGTWHVGGLIGHMEYSKINNCYSICSVSGYSDVDVFTGKGYVGGLIGTSFGESVNNSFWNTKISGQISSEGGEGKTTKEMKMQSTYVNWDFENVWMIKETFDYPQLRNIKMFRDIEEHNRGKSKNTWIQQQKIQCEKIVEDKINEINKDMEDVITNFIDSSPYFDVSIKLYKKILGLKQYWRIDYIELPLTTCSKNKSQKTKKKGGGQNEH